MTDNESDFAASLARADGVSGAQPIPAIYEQAFAARLRQAERRASLRAVRRSVVVTVLVVALAAGAAWLWLLPFQEQQAADHQTIAAVQRQIAAPHTDPQVEALQQQVQALTETVAGLQAQAGKATETATPITATPPAAAPSMMVGPLLEPDKNSVALASLQAQFPAAAKAIIAASLQTPDTSLAARAQAGLSGLFEVHKDGVLLSGNETQSRVDAASQAVAGGDVAGAVRALQGLSGPPLQAAQPWLEQAAKLTGAP